MAAASVNPLPLAAAAHGAPPYGIWEDADSLSLWQDNEYGPCRSLTDLPMLAGSMHSQQQSEQRSLAPPYSELQKTSTMEAYKPITPSKRKYSIDSCLSRAAKRVRTNSEPCGTTLPPTFTHSSSVDAASHPAERSLSHAHPQQPAGDDAFAASTMRNGPEITLPMPSSYPPPGVTPHLSPSQDHSESCAEANFDGQEVFDAEIESSLSYEPQHSDDLASSAAGDHEVRPISTAITPIPVISRLPYPLYTQTSAEQSLDGPTRTPAEIHSLPTPDSLPTCGAEELCDEVHLLSDHSPKHKAGVEVTGSSSIPREPYPFSVNDAKFIKQVKAALLAQSKWKTVNVARRAAGRIHELLEIARPPNRSEALIGTVEEAAAALECGQHFPGPIVVSNAQPLPLQTTDQFLDEFYDDTAKVWIQDPGVRLSRGIPHAREINIGQLKQRFPNKRTNVPWNCLEMATHVEDGLRPTFLNSEDCRLLTKLKIPSSGDSASRRGYDPGWKEVEKWALLAQGGALTEPHQDSHGYSTYITMNQGSAGFGWLSNPTAQERLAWRADPATYTGGRWRYVVLRPGQTVFFPSGTVHFVFRLRALGDTLAFGGHVLRCSQIVRWVEAMLEEKAGADITNEDLTVSAPAYLARVEKFVKQAVKNGTTERWGGPEAVERFLQLKREFEAPRK